MIEGRRLAAVVIAAALSAVPGAHAGLPADPGELGELVPLDDKVSVPAPADMTREHRSLGPRGDMLTLADGSDVMVVVVYRRGVSDKVPTAAEALQAHTAELERGLGTPTRHALKRRALGRDFDAVGLTVTRAGVVHEGWVVAFESRGRTIVVSAVAVKGSPNDALMVSVLKGIRVQ